MKTAVAALLALLGASCMMGYEDNTARMEYAVSALADLHTWDPVEQGTGQASYDAVMGWGGEILPLLVAHLTDTRKVAFHDAFSGRTPSIGDVCFMILLRVLKLSWKTFADDGVFVSTALPNPIFCLSWKEEPLSRKRAQERLKTLLPEYAP
jgi:hypothetical protein